MGAQIVSGRAELYTRESRALSASKVRLRFALAAPWCGSLRDDRSTTG
jgi:hypothetical protein